MAREPKIEFPVNGERIIVDFEKMDTTTRDELEAKIFDIRKGQALAFKYPYEEGETQEKWSERVGKLIEEDLTRQEGESTDDHLKRLLQANDIKNAVPDILNAVSTTFMNKEIAKDSLKSVNYLKLKRFLYDVLTLCDIPAGDLKVAAPSGK